jgi:hypothetical protein
MPNIKLFISMEFTWVLDKMADFHFHGYMILILGWEYITFTFIF